MFYPNKLSMYQHLKKLINIFRIKNKKAKIANYVVSGLFLVYFGILLYPNLFFEHSIKYKNLQLYSTTVLDNNTEKLLSEVSRRLSVSTISDTTVIHNIYLCNNFSLFSFFAPLSREAFGCNYLYLNSIFLANCDIKKNKAFKNEKGDNYIRQLDQLITHEITHRLIKEKFGPWRARRIDMWKNEGYCETIGYNETFNTDEARKFLQATININGNRIYYRKCYFAVAYLINIKKMKFESIVNSNLTLDQVLCKIEISHVENK